MAQPKSPFILVPLYIYPTPVSWEPLFLAAKSFPDLDFLVIVNPGNGPGPDALPDANYLTALATLSALPNAKVIGYVHCSYGQRISAAIEKDILTYQGWTVKDGISVSLPHHDTVAPLTLASPLASMASSLMKFRLVLRLSSTWQIYREP